MNDRILPLCALMAAAVPVGSAASQWLYFQHPMAVPSYQYIMPLYGFPAMSMSIPFYGPPLTTMYQTLASSPGLGSYNVSTQEMPGGYLVTLALQGIAPSEIRMNVRDGALVFERTQVSGPAGQGSFSFGNFFWTLPLPADADLARTNGRADQEGIRIFIPKKGF